MANCLKELRASLGSGEVNKNLVKPAKAIAGGTQGRTLEQAYLTVAKDNLAKLKAERKEIIAEITADHAKENPKTEEKAKLPKPDWWQRKSLSEQAKLLNLIGAKIQPWDKIDADTQHMLQDQWIDSNDNENKQKGEEDALSKQEAGKIYGGGSAQPEIRKEGGDTTGSGSGIQPEGQGNESVKAGAKEGEISNETNNGTTAAISNATGETDNQPGISTEQQGSVKPQGAETDNGTVPGGKRQPVTTDTGKGQRNELPGSEGLVGLETNGGNQQTVKQPIGENGSLSGDTGGVNYDLRDKPPIALTPAKRRDINNLAVELLKKPVEDITEADKEVLRQYTGNGGLDLNASKDKGAGIFNQHYTSYDTIKSMYGALFDAGVKINKALEPSVGSGNFIGMYPEADWTAVDIDQTNTDVVKRLYPEAEVFNESYETFRGKNYDLIISNVPFASYSSLAREHASTIKPAFKAIHNFFFAQSVDKLKTGGVMAFMTSTGTMDGTGEAANLRAHLIKSMDVIGAYRLPMGTQKANASTEVMIDVIFLQKRPEGVASKQPEKNQAFVDIAEKDGHKINQYFVDYPESVLGDLSIGKNKTSMGKVGWIVTGEPDYSRMTVDYQDYASTKKADTGSFKNQEEAQQYADNHGLKFVDQKTTPYFDNGFIYDKPVTYSDVTGGGLFGRKATGSNADKLALLLEIDNTHNAELVTQYENTYGKAPHNDKPLALWAKSHYAEKQLKSYLSLFDKDFNLSEIFTSKVRFEDSGKIEITQDSPLHDRAESLEDNDGFVYEKSDLVSKEEWQDLLDSGDYARVSASKLQNARLYYAGNIYKKIDELSKVTPAAQREKQLKRLEQVKPPIIPITKISITGKEKWLTSSAIASLGKKTYHDGAVIIGENAIDDNHLLHLYNQWLNNEPLVKKGKDDTQEEHDDQVKQAQNILNTEILPLIKQKLIDDGLSDEVVDAYNRSINFFAAAVFNGASLRNLPQTFRGKPFKLMQHQQEGAERAIYNKKGVLAFSPGLGKTPTAIVVADQQLQRGIMKKPLFIVPANTIPQWESSTRDLYPNAKVFEFPKYQSGINKGKVKDWPAMNAKDKEKMVNDLTNNRYDYTFISANLAQKLSVPAGKLSQYLDELTESISGMEKDDEELTKSQIKAKEQRLAKIRMLKDTIMASYRSDADAGLDMGKLGFDAIFADEVQYYKNIGMRSEDAKGGLGASVAITAKYPIGSDGKPDKTSDPISVTLGSARSYDFRFKTRYISEMNNGNNVFLLTGTPTPNKPLELMTLLHHLDTHILDEYGINNVGDFVDEFFVVSEVDEMSIDGTSKLQPQLTEMKNIPALKSIIGRYVDYRSPESAKDLTRPKQTDIIHTILRNEDAELIFADIQARLLQSIEDGKAKMRGEKIEDAEATIQMYTAGRDASIDVRLYTPTTKSTLISENTIFEEETREDYSKIAKTVSLVAKQYAKNSESGQLIFLDRLKFSGDNGSTHADIRDKVIKATGLTHNEVVFVNGGDHINPDTGKAVKGGPKPERLQQIMDYYNAGKIKVLIGNTSKLGVGVDLQVKTTDIYQIDKPYRPDEVEQRNNRGVRQGNENAEVRVHTFNQPGTFDEMSDRILANKQGFNDVFWKYQEGDTADVQAEGAPSAYEAAIELEQNPAKKRKLEIERDLSQAASKSSQIEKQISNLAKRINTATKNKGDYANAITGIDNREEPKYEDQTPSERKKSVAEFKKRMAAQREKHVVHIAEIDANLVELERDKAARQSELSAHKEHITNIRERYVVNGVVSLDAIEKSGEVKLSKNTKTTGSTKADIEALLPGRVKAMQAANKLVVVQGIKDLPEYMWQRGNILSNVIHSGNDLTGVEALYDGNNDVVYLVADMLNKDNLFPVLNHELFHRLESTDKKLSDTIATFNKDFKKRFDDAAQGIGSEIELKAYKRVMAAKTREADRLHEFKAYIVTEYSKNPNSFVGELKKLLQQLFAAIRVAMLKAGMPLRHLTPADLAALAMQGAKLKVSNSIPLKANVSEAQPLFSRSEITNAITEALTPTKGQKSLGWTAGLFQRNHLIDMAVKHLPMLKDYKRLSQEKDSFINQSEQVIHDAYLIMQKSMNHKVMTELGRVQGLATRLKNFDPDTFDGDIAELSTEEREVYEDFEAMPEAAKSAYRTMRDDYRKDLEAKKKALIERIEDFSMDRITQQQIIAEITKHFDRTIKKGVYFPLSRNGDFVVIGKKFDEDGAELVEDRVVEHVENERIAEKVASEMEAQGYTQTKITLKDKYIASTDGAKAANKIAALATKAIADLKTSAAEQVAEGMTPLDVVGSEEFNALMDEFNQQLINALPDTSYRKHFIHRKGTLGYSTDTLRAYAGTRTSAAKTIAALKFDHKINKELESANQAVTEMGNTQAGRTNTVMLKSVMGELRLREDKLKTTDISQASQLLTSLGFMGALGFNVSSAAINMLQVPSMTFPELAGRYNAFAASKALKGAYGLLFNKNALDKQSGFDLRKHQDMEKPENAPLKRALEALNAIGKIDLTMTHEAVAMGRNPSYSDNAAIRAVGNISKWAGYPFHVAEALNRQVTGIAAFNLAYKKHGDFDRALEETIDVIDRTQFDYSMANRSRHMMGNTARVLTLFKAYAIGMSYYVGRNAHDAIAKLPSERRTEARKTLVAQMAMTFATSGLFGLPIGIEAMTMAGGLAGFKYRGANFAIAGAVGANFAMQALLAGLGYDDDDELETDFRNWLTDNFNQTFAEFVTKGPARLLPLADISGRTGLSDLWWHKQNKELEGRDQFNAIANALMGPLGSQVQGLFVAKKMYDDGEYFRMFESAVPAALRNAIAAGRMAKEGVKTIKGDPIIQRDLSWDEIFAKTIGFNPDVVANASARNAAITRQADKTSMKKAHLVNRYVGANAQDRLELMRGDIKAFNATVPVQERITWASLRKSIKLRKSADKRTKGGVYLSKRQEHLLDIGRFAEPE